MLRFKNLFVFICTFTLLLLSAVSFSSCEEDEDTLTVEFTVGDVVSNKDSVTIIGPSSYKIHYAGEVYYEAGIVLSTALPFTQTNSAHLPLEYRGHKASNHESYTGFSWPNITITHHSNEPVKLTYYYTLYIKLNDGTYYYGPSNKTFVYERKE